jgi:uncharacterized protein YndB with AHSA1/START domain
MNKEHNREMRITRTLNAPVELVWEACTKPEHLANWWGPIGYKNTVHQMDFWEGGIWEMTMLDPNGTTYAYKSVFRELVRYRKIVYEHFEPGFIATILFDSLGNKTVIDWSMIIETAELKDFLIREHKADIGQTQNMDRLEAYVDDLHKVSNSRQ